MIRIQRSMSARRLAAVVALLLPALVACTPARIGEPSRPSAGSSVAVTQSPKEVRLTTKEWSFTPTSLQLPAGQPVKLVLDNQGNLEHDLTIPALNVRLTAGAGKSASVTVTAGKEGTYPFECSIPGHKETGMKGSAVVSGAPAASGTGAAVEAGAADKASSTATQHVAHDAVATTQTKGNQRLDVRLEGDVKVFDLKAQHVKWEVLPGEYVDAYAYNGQVPGPVIRVTEGDKVKVNFTNELPEPTVIHFHGPTLPNSMDGVPDVTQKVVEPGKSFAYQFTARPGGTFMYHTHHNSAEQEPKGLYGLFIVDPKQPTVKYDKEVVQVISELGGYYVINGKSFPATEPIEAKLGEKVLVRLVNLGQMAHPMHMHGMPFKIVGTDGYPVPDSQALTKDVVNIGPGERYDLLVTTDNPGTWVFHCHILSHVQNHGVEPGGMITVVKVS